MHKSNSYMRANMMINLDRLMKSFLWRRKTKCRQFYFNLTITKKCLKDDALFFRFLSKILDIVWKLIVWRFALFCKFSPLIDFKTDCYKEKEREFSVFFLQSVHRFSLFCWPFFFLCWTAVASLLLVHSDVNVWRCGRKLLENIR